MRTKRRRFGCRHAPATIGPPAGTNSSSRHTLRGANATSTVSATRRPRSDGRRCCSRSGADATSSPWSAWAPCTSYATSSSGPASCKYRTCSNAPSSTGPSPSEYCACGSFCTCSQHRRIDAAATCAICRIAAAAPGAVPDHGCTPPAPSIVPPPPNGTANGATSL